LKIGVCVAVAMGVLVTVAVLLNVYVQNSIPEMRANLAENTAEDSLARAYSEQALNMLGIAPFVLISGVAAYVILFYLWRDHMKPEEPVIIHEATGFCLTPEQQEEMRNAWTCSYCLAYNPAEELKCHVCGAARRKAEAVS
jgi:hypothetical protein